MSESLRDSMLSAALERAQLGTPVFPCSRSTKQPLVAGGYKAATTEVDQVKKRWEYYPSAMIGVPTGLVSGLIVLDIDVDKETLIHGFVSLFMLEVQYGALPETYTVKTPRGGEHRYFRYPDTPVRNSAGLIGVGLDIRGDGGYVIAPPSVNQRGQRYEIMQQLPLAQPPAWLLKLLLKKSPDKAKDSLASAVHRVSLAQKGTRNVTLNQATFELGGFVRNGLLDEQLVRTALLQAALTSGLSITNANKTIQSSLCAGIEKYTSIAIGPAEQHSANDKIVQLDAITAEEWKQAKSTPECIVENLYYADVGLLIAPGGTGKTTLFLYIAVHIALGLKLFGLSIIKPGPVAIVSAEDSREMLIARTRSICSELQLTPDQIETVQSSVLICDVSGFGVKLTEVERDAVRPADKQIQQIVDECLEKRPVMVIFDPAVSFGIGESRVNDAEQGLIEAGRRLRRALNCCVEYVHHTGKQNARDKASDQYAGRGGSAFADGSRMVHVLRRVDGDEWTRRTGSNLEEGEMGLILARPKMSYTAPQPDLLIRRSGYRFDWVLGETDTDTVGDVHACSVLQIIVTEVQQGRFPTQNSIEQFDCGLKRREIRRAIQQLECTGRVQQRPIPGNRTRGARSYLYPIAAPTSGPASPTKTKPGDPHAI